MTLSMLNVSRPRSLVLPCVLARFCVLLEELNEAAAASSESSGVGSGGGNWMLVRSGREPPVLWAAGFSELVNCWSGDGNMLQKVHRCSFIHKVNTGYLLQITEQHLKNVFQYKQPQRYLDSNACGQWYFCKCFGSVLLLLWRSSD